MKKNGFALISVLVFAIITAILLTAILNAKANLASMLQMSGAAMINAQYLAEAGVQHGIWESRNGISSPTLGSPVVGFLNVDGRTVEITKTMQADGSIKIESTVAY
ncbi:MAG TPA: hypothetical protein PLO78_07535 [Candidatus Omnitrophota bacterium]|nr:hypothetical protein [Candidatus Omnitrophota bacterium]